MTDCANKNSKHWSRANPEKRRCVKYRDRYGITLEQYNKKFQSQNGQCAICGTIDFGDKFSPVDHNHETTQVRGILCDSCNRGLGYFKENTEALLDAIHYLERWDKVEDM